MQTHIVWHLETLTQQHRDLNDTIPAGHRHSAGGETCVVLLWCSCRVVWCSCCVLACVTCFSSYMQKCYVLNAGGGYACGRLWCSCCSCRAVCCVVLVVTKDCQTTSLVTS